MLVLFKDVDLWLGEFSIIGGVCVDCVIWDVVEKM